ncbi:UNVERIFIED_CONTAM: hypothetical protein FKN15_063111 [Acipenser sinensis]
MDMSMESTSQKTSSRSAVSKDMELQWGEGRKVKKPRDEADAKVCEIMVSTPEEEQPSPSDITVFAGGCTLHGVNHIFLPGGITIRQLLWACAFLSSLSIFLYQVADRIIFYLEFHHVTTLDEMDSPSMYFPAISFCNYNSYRKSQINRNDLFWMGALLGVAQADFPDFLQAIGQQPDSDKFFPSKSFNMLEFVQKASHNIEEMLLDCKYRGKDCGAENFTTC